jgi:hypothetical protein
MSYRVDLVDTGTWLLAADAADLGEICSSVFRVDRPPTPMTLGRHWRR